MIVGQHCNIFKIDLEFALWPNQTGDGRNAWTLYTYEVPEGCVALTGDLETMSLIANQIFGQTFTSLNDCYNYFCSLADGTYNYLTIVLP